MSSKIKITLSLWFSSFVIQLILILYDIFHFKFRKLGNIDPKLLDLTRRFWYAALFGAISYDISCASGAIEFLFYISGSKGAGYTICAISWFYGPTFGVFGKAALYISAILCMAITCTHFPQIHEYNRKYIEYFGLTIVAIAFILIVLVQLTHEIRYGKNKGANKFEQCDGFVPDWIIAIVVLYDFISITLIIYYYILPIYSLKLKTGIVAEARKRSLLVKIGTVNLIGLLSTFIFCMIIGKNNTTLWQPGDNLIHTIVLLLSHYYYLQLHEILAKEYEKNDKSETGLEEKDESIIDDKPGFKSLSTVSEIN